VYLYCIPWYTPRSVVNSLSIEIHFAISGRRVIHAVMDQHYRRKLMLHSSPCSATTITSPWVASSIRPPPSWTSQESYLVPPVVVMGTGMLSVVRNCKPLGRTEKSSTLPTPPTLTSSLADRPRLVCPLDIQPLGWGHCCVEQLLPFGAFPPWRMSGFSCSLALPKVSGPLCLRAILREHHGAVNWDDRLGLGPPQGAQCHIVW